MLPGLIGINQDSEGGGGRHCSPPSMNTKESWCGSAGAADCPCRLLSERRRIERDLATSCFVGQPLALCADQRAIGTGLVVVSHLDPIVVAEIKFCEISVEVLLFNVLINTDQAALEDREEAFEGVGVHVAAHPFLFGMVNAFVPAVRHE